jgi:hypothetical protein
MHFTNFVIHTGVKKNTLGGGGFSCVNVRGNTDIAITLDGSYASHDQPLGIQLKQKIQMPCRVSTGLCGRLTTRLKAA